MKRASIVFAFGVCALATASRLAAQPPPEGWVVLGIDEYKALRERAQPPAPLPPPPPVDATITRIEYDLRVDGESVAGRALLTIDVIKDGWVQVAIPAGLLVRGATLDGGPVPLVDGPPPHVVLSRRGRTTLALDIVMPIASSAGTESIALPASRAPLSRATFVLPKSGVDLSVGGGFIAERTESANQTRWVVIGRTAQPLAFSWKRRVDDRRAEQALRVRARITEIVGLGEDSGQVTAGVRVEVIQGLAREARIALPAGLVVNQVTGATVGDWEVTSGTLRVGLLEPAASEVAFVVSGEIRTPRDGSIAIPLVRMPSAERETGGIAVDVIGAGEIGARRARGFEPADPSELGELLAGRDSPSMVAFRAKPLGGADPRSLDVTVTRYTPQAVLVANVEEARYRALASEDGRLLVEARFAVRNNQRSFLKVTLPPGSTVWSAEVAGRPIRPGVAGADAILLPLEKGRAGGEAPTFVVQLLYLQKIGAWIDRGRAHLDLPALDLPVSRTGLTLHHSPRFRVEMAPGVFRVETDPGPIAPALRSMPEDSRVNAPPPRAESEERSRSGLQALVDRYRNEAGARAVVGSLPVRVMFPEFGPSVFLASELTAEAHATSIDLTFRRTKG